LNTKNITPKDNNNNDGQSAFLPRRKALSTLAAITVIPLLAVIFVEPLTALMQKSIPTCMLLTLTGLHCPLCGGTRCIKALAQLDIAGALYYNPVIVLTGIFCVVQYIRFAVCCLRREYRPFRSGIGEKGMWIILAVYLVFFVVRNMAFYKAYLY